jgi:hypothetical protein
MTPKAKALQTAMVALEEIARAPYQDPEGNAEVAQQALEEIAKLQTHRWICLVLDPGGAAIINQVHFFWAGDLGEAREKARKLIGTGFGNLFDKYIYTVNIDLVDEGWKFFY